MVTTNPKKTYLGNLFVIAAASGSGKTSLVRELVNSMLDLQVSVSHTTRSPRSVEQTDHHYFFVSSDQFKRMLESNQFLEYAQVFGHFYGTSSKWVEERLQQGIDVILEIDWQGAQQVKQKFSDSISIFILPPSLKVLHERLRGRNQDSPEIIAKRFEAASSEIAHYDEFDYLVVNDVFENALHDLQVIITAQRLRQKVQAKKHRALLADLLKNK
jgi:guanylate kinase